MRCLGVHCTLAHARDKFVRLTGDGLFPGGAVAGLPDFGGFV